MAEIYYSGKSLKVESLEFGVKKIIFTRPDIRNAFNEKMISEITSVVSELSAIHDINEMRLLIIEGEGKVFCSGADISYMKEQAKKNHALNLEDARALGRMFFKLASVPCPVISVVQGAAIGGGFGIAACSDFVLAEKNAIFSTSEVLLGIVPGVISPYIIRKIGVANSSPFLLSGKRMAAEECLLLGIVNKITEFDKLPHELNKTINSFLMAAPNAVRRTKLLIKNASPLPSQAQFDFTAEEIAAARCSDEAKTGLDSFFEKTTPYWCNGITK